MATLNILDACGVIERIEVELDVDVQPERVIYGFPRFVRWLNEDLDAYEGSHHGQNSPLEQVDAFLDRYIRGERLRYRTDLHELKPLEDDVWELKTADVRIFGWFVSRDIFVAVNAGFANVIKNSRGM